MVRTNDRLINHLECSSLLFYNYLQCLLKDTSPYFFILSENPQCHPHLLWAKPVLCAHKCDIPFCQKTCWELSHIKSASYGVWECQFEGPHYSLRGHVKMEHLATFFSTFLLPEAFMKLEGEPFETWQLIAGRNKGGSMVEINTLYK